MQIPEEGTLLRIFVGESDRLGGHPLYEAIVLKARELHLAGATVVRGVMSYGRNSRLHTAKILRLSEDLPVVVEIVDSEEKIQTLLPWLESVVTGGLVTLERARVIRYVGDRGPAGNWGARPGGQGTAS
jgi:PII-like signaling protein